MKRILLFLAVNMAVILVLSIVLGLLGIGSILDEQGTGLDYRALLIFAVVLGFGGSFISLAISKWTAKIATGAKVITKPSNETETWLLSIVKKQAEEVGVGMPEVAIFNSPAPNAFATGMNRNNALVAVSTGLLQAMNKDEVEAVLGHEMSHVANGDMITLTLIQGVLNTFVIFLSRVVGFFVDRVLLKNDKGLGLGFYLTTLVTQILFGILASIIVLWFSRQREFRADQGGGNLAGREKMIAALEKLQHSSGKPLPEQISAFGISGKQEKKASIKTLFMSHPPLEERIAALKNTK
jgi:heat shock protein HtpX